MSDIQAQLAAHRETLQGIDLPTLIDTPGRERRWVRTLGDLTVDCTRHLAHDTTLDLLFDLARAHDVESLRDAMFVGEAINTTEGRAVLHVALRNRSDRPIVVDGTDVMPAVRAELEHMRSFCDAVHSGEWTGHSGERIRDVVNIGIGGSDLGPVMATEALRPWWHEGLTPHFVSNVDPSHLSDTVAGLDPASTLFIVSSKTFGTQETLANATAARDWLTSALGADAVARHFVAVSTRADRVAAFGIDPSNMFTFWDWVGGRYSMWSSIGLSIALTIGFDRFSELLDGAHELDEHFRGAPLEDNIPVMLGLLDCWYRDFWNCQCRAVLPYDQHLHRLPAYLQQLEMESNGKHVRLDGTPVGHGTAFVVWGEPGTNGQHSFHQMLHQGTTLVPCDIMLGARSTTCDADDRRSMLAANALAQAEALARGRDLDTVRATLAESGMDDRDIAALAPHKVMPGNRPSTTILYRVLDPATLGRLIALHEHRVFVQGAVWEIDSFDQWGVELGKTLAGEILPGVRGDAAACGDATTRRLVARLHELRGGSG